MLLELMVRDLGVIDEMSLILGPGMTALTGETGAGKTLVVEAVELLMGGRADPVLVRPGAEGARVDARFVTGDDELVLSRVVPARGRSRAYVDGRPATAAELSDLGRELVDLHGQHAHQSLLGVAVQRAALDRFGAVDRTPLLEARARLATIDEARGKVGGDRRARAREADLLRFQVDEIGQATIGDADEDAALEAEEDRLADAGAHREAGEVVRQAVSQEDGALDAIAAALNAVSGRRPFVEIEARLRAVAAELTEVSSDARATAEAIDDDPERLEVVRARRHLLRDLQRKYGDTLSEVIAFAATARARLAELDDVDNRAAELDAERTAVAEAVDRAAAEVGRVRRAASGRMGKAIERHLRELALPRARFEVDVGVDDPGDDVRFLLSANPGEPTRPLAKIASGGELARAMLAARLVLTAGPPTLVFDEVDAGIGGEAALAVGRALATLVENESHQVLVVTHLPQVAAFADQQVAVQKTERAGRTVASARAVEGDDRVIELSRMLSGQPASSRAQGHAEELLDHASQLRASQLRASQQRARQVRKRA
jgi:DNA repair protein RecN (Recombination protein N)